MSAHNRFQAIMAGAGLLNGINSLNIQLIISTFEKLNSLKYWTDFSSVRRQLKNTRLKMGGIASACNSSYIKLAFQW